MSRIDQLFQEKKNNILSIYITAGYPGLNDTVEIIHVLQDNGADMIEIGIPFSDPLADGPVIQHSSQVALKNGMNPSLLFQQLEKIRSTVHIPLVMMGYLNVFMQYGFDAFLKDAASVGIDGLIIPDLPSDVYASDYMPLFRKHGISFSMLITPQTDQDRIRHIASLTEGFLYMVADSATTGAKGNIGTTQLEYFKRIQQMRIPIPVMIGFGISNRETFQTACRYANGAIIGSAFIDCLTGNSTTERAVAEFLAGIVSP